MLDVRHKRDCRESLSWKGVCRVGSRPELIFAHVESSHQVACSRRLKFGAELDVNSRSGQTSACLANCNVSVSLKASLWGVTTDAVLVCTEFIALLSWRLWSTDVTQLQADGWVFRESKVAPVQSAGQRRAEGPVGNRMILGKNVCLAEPVRASQQHFVSFRMVQTSFLPEYRWGWGSSSWSRGKPTTWRPHSHRQCWRRHWSAHPCNH